MVFKFNKLRRFGKLGRLALLTTCIAVLPCVGVAAGQNSSPLRYFSQTPEMYASETAYGNNAIAGHYVQSGDAKIYYEIYGKNTGTPFLVLHGGGLGSAYEMGHFVDKLKDSHQVILISTRGHGRSEIGHTPFSLEQRADDIHAVLQDAKVNAPVIAIGFSDGGYSGYAFAAKYPAEIKKLVTIGSGEVLQTNKRFVFDLEEWKQWDADFVAQQHKLMPEPERWQEMLNMYADMWNGAVISKELLSQVKCPTLVMGGENDINSPMLTEIAAYQELPNSQLSIIPNTPHPCFLVNFDAVWGAMAPFIADEK